MSEEVIRYGAGGVPYRTPAPESKKENKAEPKVEVTVEVSEEETSEEDLTKLGLTNDENV
jgi:hypothetical protein